MSRIGFLFLVLLWAAPVAAQGGDEGAPAPKAVSSSKLEEGIRELSSAQAQLEFFFMEAGVYPSKLSDLSAAFNEQVPNGARAVTVAKDPATGNEFVYVPAPNRKGYKLRFPDPTLYGLAADFELGPVSWGWLALRAERKRFEEMAKMSKYHLEMLATSAEMYAKDNKGVYPKTIDALFPKYLKRHPQDPITGKNYLYKTLADGYLVLNPNPERYGLSLFQYSSSRGMQVEPLPPPK